MIFQPWMMMITVGGRLTNHKKFGEAMAILAGDALFLDPYALIAQADLPSQIKVDLIANLSLASGSLGMVAGQVLDMEGEHQHLSLEELQTIHANKTGKLLAYPFQAAAIIAELAPEIQAKLKTVGELIGLAFQVRDDVLDVTANFEEIGKTPQKDLQAENQPIQPCWAWKRPLHFVTKPWIKLMPS